MFRHIFFADIAGMKYAFAASLRFLRYAGLAFAGFTPFRRRHFLKAPGHFRCRAIIASLLFSSSIFAFIGWLAYARPVLPDYAGDACCRCFDISPMARLR